MKSEILNSTPISGEYPEQYFGEHFNSFIWVKFTDNNFEEWLGCFSKLHKAPNTVLTDANNETALVLAGGRAYMIDITRKELIYKTEDIPTIESAILSSIPNYYLLGAWYKIYVLNKQGLIKTIEKDFALDGIYFTEQIKNKAIGHLYSYQYGDGDDNVGFELDLETFELTIDLDIRYRHVDSFEFIKVKDK